MREIADNFLRSVAVAGVIIVYLFASFVTFGSYPNGLGLISVFIYGKLSSLTCSYIWNYLGDILNGTRD